MSLVLHSVSFKVDGTQLLDQVSVDIKPACITALIGPNGAGKTTLLRIASGELVAKGVMLDDQPISDCSLESRARRVAFLTQSSALDFPFTGLEVMHMGRIPHLTGALRDRRVVEEVVDKCDLGNLSKRIYTTLSGGEKQRIQIGRVLCQVWDDLESAYVLFDEPTAALDLAHQLTFFNIIQMLRDRGAAVVVVLHDINLASKFADQICVLASGQVLATGSPGEVITSSNIGKAFGVSIDTLGLPERPVIQVRATL
jgi:iron complex transport system ATP-binding protein